MSTTVIPKTAGDGFIKAFKVTSRALRELKKVDPRQRYVLLLPSAHSSYVGMAFKLLNVQPAEDIFEHASSIVKKDILKMCLNGPKMELLDSIENRHLAAFVTTQATIAKLKHEKPDIISYCKAAGGFGIGFVNSLVFSGSMSFENALDLVQRQGKAMDKASTVIPSARVKIRIMPATSKRQVCLAAREHCIKLGIPEKVAQCSVTHQRHAHVLEVAGHEEAIKFLETEGTRIFNFRWLSRILSTPQAYHTRLMQPASDFLRIYIDQRVNEDPQYIKEPETCSVYSSTAGFRLRNVEQIKKDLVQYPTRAILSEQLMHCLFARPKSLPQPNVIVLWDKSLRDNLKQVNRLAYEASELFG